MDRLIRLDGRDPAEVELAIRYAAEHAFYRKSLTVQQFRRQYDRLRLEAEGEQRGRGPNAERHARTADRLARAAAGGAIRAPDIDGLPGDDVAWAADWLRDVGQEVSEANIRRKLAVLYPEPDAA